MRTATLRIRPVVLAASALVVGACSDRSTPMAPTASPVPARPSLERAASEPARETAGPSERTRYIVLFKRDVDDVPGKARALAAQQGGETEEIWEALKGFSVRLPAQAAERMARNPNVEVVAPDTPVSMTATITPPSWGLDRIDERTRPMDGLYTFDRTGAGVHVYVMDSGIRASHTQFGGRVSGGVNFVPDGRTQNQDCNGHGTHVAGTIGGATTGVAHAVSLHSVRVFGCNSGFDLTSVATITAGINWIMINGVRPAVVNMSLAGIINPALDAAVDALSATGFVVVVAAGNDDADACWTSPARAATAIAVGATTSSDARADFSNFGSCVDIWAPGTAIRSADAFSTTGTAVMQGTSMAAPHVAGAAALLLSKGVAASNVRAQLVSNATTNALTGLQTGSPNRLLFTRFIN